MTEDIYAYGETGMEITKRNETELAEDEELRTDISMIRTHLGI